MTSDRRFFCYLFVSLCSVYNIIVVIAAGELGREGYQRLQVRDLLAVEERRNANLTEGSPLRRT
jgi:hypothetical protein